MFGLKGLIKSKSNPIGVDFGSECLRMAQVAPASGEWKLAAAASADVPSHVRHDPVGRMGFFIEATRELFSQGGFTGRSAVLALPAASMFIQHLRLPKMDEEALKKAIPWEARGKLPIDPSQAVMRHHIAGEVYQDQDSRSEVILMAAGRELVNQFIAMANKAKIDIVGMNVEPRAVVDCFAHLWRRKNDSGATNFFIDMGCSGSRAFIAKGSHIMFARNIAVGGDHLTRAVSNALSISLEEAKLLRLKVCAHLQQQQQQQRADDAATAPARHEESSGESLAMLGAADKGARQSRGAVMEQPAAAARGALGSDIASQVLAVEQACREPLRKLLDELNLCRRYYEATFPSAAVDRLVFVGGEAKHRNLCQYLARELGLAAQIGDPLARMGKISDISIESGIDRNQPQPNWAVAIGLSLGPIDGQAVPK